ncbi:UDP-glycosyltransferase 82A1-like isoform X2 [Phragmites australis]|uniref:UDP-glycosyltransferase 82A1-like isoform X2 n=1 Tax=Phragmites australis TaxID=29695 RepID=UPI002D7760B3|nr:UDP-glycosyltransferase 82A1-like isoform X2 [Phragmites australis]
MAAEVAQHIVFVPFAAQGHVAPMLHLAHAVAVRGDVSATVAVPDFIHRRMSQYSGEAGAGVALVPIPSSVPDDGGDEPPGPASIVHSMEHHMPAQLEGMLTTQRGIGALRVSCLVVDLLASWAIPVAARCGLPVVGFWVGMLATYRTVAVIPELIGKGFISESGILLPRDGIDEDHFDKHQDIGDVNILPAKLKLRMKDFPWLVGGGGGGALSQKSRFAFWLQTVDRAKNLRSILVNSFRDEGGDSDRYDPPEGQQILHVGPVLLSDDLKKTTTMWLADETCMGWLDKQSPESVIYVSFGSWAAPIGPDKITGFARGLEASGRPFLWVLKNHPSWRAGLPDRYTEKVDSRGKIISWAPQDDVLQHVAVGCYIMHCGWNSMLEAVRYGVRMICYPISADHFINCAYIINMWEAGIALVSSDQSDVKDCIERVMEGEEGSRLKGKVNELREKIMGGDAVRVAKMSLDLFMEGIKNHDTETGGK